MSYSVRQPQEGRRPGIVTAAAYLMILVGVLELANVIVNFSVLSKIVDATQRAYSASPTVDTMVAVARIGGIVSGVLGLLLAAGFVIVALFDLRGSNAARIVSWVLGGIGVLCFGCGALGQAGGSALANLQRGSANGVNVQEATRRIQEAVPAWVAPIAVTIVIINLLASILVIVLLALPAANEFFRRGRGVPEADLAYPGYPPVPGYPPPAGPPAAGSTGQPPAPPAGPQPPAGPPPAGPPTEGS